MNDYAPMIGILLAVFVPVLINLKIFARSSELEALRLHVAQEDARIERWVLQTFSGKEDVRSLKDDLDRRLDTIDKSINELKSMMMNQGNNH